MAQRKYPCDHVVAAQQKRVIHAYKIVASLFVFPLTNEARKRKATSVVCGLCSSKTNRLHTCLLCVNFRCFEDNHMREHFEKSGHFTAVCLNSGNTYCFKCKDYFYDFKLMEISRLYKNACFRMNGIEPYAEWEPGSAEIELIKRNGGYRKINENSYIGLKGLINLGNTCFISSILQVLVHTSLLRDYFLCDQHSCAKRGDCLACEMFKIYQVFYSGSSTPHSPHDLIHKMWKQTTKLAGYDQEDAQYFLLEILDALHVCCQEDGGRKPSDTSDECRCVIHQIFTGFFQSNTICGQCKDESSKIDLFWDISLHLNNETNKDTKLNDIKLEDLIYRYTHPEDIVASCSKCNNKQKTKQMMIKKLPIITCFHLKRLQDVDKKKNSKIDAHIEFPEILDLSPFVASNRGSKNELSNGICLSDSNNMNFKFILIAVVNHRGEHSGGHYYSYVRQLGHNWFKCNDEEITKVSLSEVLKSKGYLLFYQKQTLEYELKGAPQTPMQPSVKDKH